jgi:hypothetical protein
MKCKYSVTFEFEVSKPITVTGEASGSSARTVIARAVGDAVKKNKNMRWSSIVAVIEKDYLNEAEEMINESSNDNDSDDIKEE